ncbi:ATP-binding protein [Donghicola sp. XS_ASV15]|uniref:ATP-binding response regulator n=1 Tax=Donghicola sp. XS_ASV15 TaxID=3241295 RepID=UPI00351201E0
MPHRKIKNALRQSPVTVAALVLGVFLLGVGAALSLVPEMSTMALVGTTLMLLGITGLTFALVLRLSRPRHVRKMTQRFEMLLDAFPCPALITDVDGNVLQVGPGVSDLLPGADIGCAIFPSLQEDAQKARDLLADCLLGRRSHGVCALAHDAFSMTLTPLEGERVLWTLCNRTVPEEHPAPEDDHHHLRLALGRNGAILWMNSALRDVLSGSRRNVRDVFLDPPLEHGKMVSLRSPRGIKEYLVVDLSRENGRREIMLAPPPATVQRLEQPDIEHLPVAILSCSPDGALLSANRAARRLLYGDTATPRSLPAHLSGVLEGLGRSLSEWLQQVANGQAVGQTEFMRLLEQERERYVQVTLSPQRDGQDKSRVMVLLTDATDLKALEAKFAQTQKMQAVGQLAGGVAHDFNNLLTAISGHCDLLLLRHEPQDPEYADLIQIAQNANRAAALVGQLLAFSRKQTLNPEQLDVGATLSELTHLLNRLVGEKVNLNFSQQAARLPIRADKRQLEQVLMNLVVNARDAMPDGGEIRIESSECQYDFPVMRDRAQIPAGSYIVISVEDDGVGIPFEHQHKVFEPFFTSKKAGEGTGLGLSTAYGIVKQSGGYIFLTSAPGRGTRFDLLFPVDQSEQIVAITPAEPVRLRHGEGRVLLVEDEAPVRAFATRALQMRGYEVIEAASGEEALERFSEAGFHVDVVVTDVIMPGKDGPTWVAEALANRPDIPVVFVSGYAEETFEDAKKVIANSVFLPKPFSLTDLTATVQAQMGEQAA